MMTQMRLAACATNTCFYLGRPRRYTLPMAKPSKNPKPPIPAAIPAEEGAPRTPLWETLSMIAAFVLLWIWFAAHKSAQNSGAALHPAWTAALLAALGMMALITVRRMQRFKRALEETRQQSQRRPGAMPWMPPDRNGHN